MTPHDDESYESREQLRRDLLADEEFRYAYAESFVNTYVAAQLKALRELRGMTQKDLAAAIGTQQAGVSRLENVNYSAWKTETLRKIARALGVRLKISFETFGTLLDEVQAFNRKLLERPVPENDADLIRAAIRPKARGQVIRFNRFTLQQGTYTGSNESNENFEELSPKLRADIAPRNVLSATISEEQRYGSERGIEQATG